MAGSLMGAAAFAAVAVHAQPYPTEVTPYPGQVARYTAPARVVRAVPVRETFTTAARQECWVEPSGAPRSGNQAAGAVIGGIAGGIIGNQFGSGSGNTAATIAGALGGAAVGNEVARRNNRGEAMVERCREVAGQYDERVVGYDVTYRFQGREFNARLPYDPGPELPVQVTVAPAR